MASGGSAIRGSRVGSSSSIGESRGIQAERTKYTFWCANGHSFDRHYLATVLEEEIPVELDCPHCGQLAGRDQLNPPETSNVEPYKTHLAYVKERRTEQEAQELLDEALATLRNKRARALAEAKK